MAKKYVYNFGGGRADGNGQMKNLLGGKGAGLAEMARIGIPVPAGFTITTDVCTAYYKNNQQYPTGLDKQVADALQTVEKMMEARFGDPENPLLVSCRSGARVSMPGMMDTVLNIGLNDQTIVGLIEKTGNPRFAYDAYRRFVSMYGDVVMGLKPEEKAEDPFEEIMQARKKKRGVTFDLELEVEDLQWLVKEFKALIKRRLKKSFPEDPQEQLWGAIGAVFRSWMVPRAVAYREINNIPGDWGTAVNVQSMVFGNMGEDSATGVAFTRDPATGENYFYGEYLPNAQGEDVVAGIRTPQPINRVKPLRAGMESTLEDEMPKLYKQLVGIRNKLEKHYKEMQDVEFTIQQGKLWMLQTRTGKRTAAAAIKIAVEMVKEKLISKQDAVARIDSGQLDQLLHPMFDPKAKKEVVAKGLPASPGAAMGQVVFSAADAEVEHDQGRKVILVRIETSPDDIKGMNVAQGILTARGGMTSHAAVVARGMGKPCVAGASDILVDYAKEHLKVGDRTVKKLDWISLDGARGEVILGQVPTVQPHLGGDFGTIMSWVDQIRQLKVRTNADTPHDAQVARDFGAEGIGLCRTEHMFFSEDRIDAVREMILADDTAGRKKALDKLLPMQRKDFIGIFRAMDGLPVTIRTLDPPLHEFLPHTDEEIKDLAKKLGVKPIKIRDKTESLKEANPMLGHRGCRLGVMYPEITAMQARAIMEAAVKVTKEGKKVLPEIMIPLVAHIHELELQREVVDRVAREVMDKAKVNIKYMVGTMIELPRAAITADEIAKEAEFFSFGTNDLTQTVFGLSRDDAGKFLPSYVKEGILERDPFVALDQDGVGVLVRMGLEKGRQTRNNLKVGICGEHGGEPSSVEFCHRVGMNYVSCSPFRVPIARLAAAQAVIKEKQEIHRDV
ncbi:MAG: pyruvate, phosphate dikinase [Thermodesulfobacteriota bacterium]